MKINEVVKVLTEAVPVSETWCTGELYGPCNINGSGGKEAKRILFAVTPTVDVEDYFEKNGYDLLVAHHPFKPSVPSIVLHTALDCCPGGLNDMWRDKLGIKRARHFDRNLGWYGKIEPISWDKLVQKIKDDTGIDGVVRSDYGVISSVVVCSGLGGLVYDMALDTGVDCYVTGECNEYASRRFPALIEVGHTRNERIGVEFIRNLLPECQVDVAPLGIDHFGREEVDNEI